MQNESLCSLECSSGELAKFLELTDRRIRKMAQEEIIPQFKRGRFQLQPTVMAYIKYIKDGGKSGTMRGGKSTTTCGTTTTLESEGTLAEEKAQLTRVQRKQAELKLQSARGEVHKSSDVKALVGGMIVTTRSRLLDIPAKLAPKLVGKKDLDAVKDAIEAEIVLALQSLVEYDPEPYRQRQKDYEGAENDAANVST
ncbi:MAG: hypothetical protein ABFC57_17330 [Veillonellales bacterium]